MMNKTKSVFILTAVIGLLVIWMAYDRYSEKKKLQTAAE